MARVIVRPTRVFWAGKNNGVGHLFSLKSPKGPTACGRVVKKAEIWTTPPKYRLCKNCLDVQSAKRQPMLRKGLHGIASPLAATDSKFILSGASSRGTN